MPIPRPLLNVLRSSPVLNVVSAMSSSHPRILMWHRFGPRTTTRVVGVDLFDKQMAELRANFNVVSATEVCAAKVEGRLRRRTVAVTVDDGYEDFYAYALPVLRKYQIPATLYVTSAFVDQRLWLWPDRLRYAIENTPKDRIEVPVNGQLIGLDVGTAELRERSWHFLADYALTLPTSAAQTFLSTVIAELRTSVPDTPTVDFRALNWDQLREVAAAGIEVGAHTVTHPLLTQCTESEIRTEVSDSMSELENTLQRPVTSIAYPHGVCNADVRRIVREVGYHNAFSGTGLDYRIRDVFDVNRYGGGDDMVCFRNAAFGVHFAAGRFGYQV